MQALCQDKKNALPEDLSADQVFILNQESCAIAKMTARCALYK